MQKQRVRIVIILYLVGVLLIILFGRLFYLSIIENAEWSNISKNLAVKTSVMAAPRGEILDRYGKVIAGSKRAYVIKLMRGNLKDDEINKSSVNLVKILKKNKDKLIDKFPIKKKKLGYYYIYDQNIKDWLKSQDLPENMEATDAIKTLRQRFGIDEKYSVHQAVEMLKEQQHIFPPINLVSMEYFHEINKEEFLSKYGISKNENAESAYQKLLKYFHIKEVDEELKMKVLTIRDTAERGDYRRYVPISIANDASLKSVLEIEENDDKYKGFSVTGETTRYYPYKNLASHVLGYLGQSGNDENGKLVGKSGIESIYEKKLRGSDGLKRAEVDVTGREARTIEYKKAKKGSNVYTTIDLELQKVTDKALKKALSTARDGGSYKSKYGDVSFPKKYKNAKSGAAVAVDVKTGKVLAMSSFPNFDPNVFSANRISNEDWQKLQSENPRDPISPAPLYNVATSSAVQTGSVFKMVTAVAAINSGLNPYQHIYDKGHVKFNDRTFGCVLWNQNKTTHGSLDLKAALKVSCNYYFYCLMRNKDLSSGRGMGFTSVLDATKLSYYAKAMGLGVSTGIELPEKVVALPSQERKFKAAILAVETLLINNADKYFTSNMLKDKTKLSKTIEYISGLVRKNPYEKELKKILDENGIKSSVSSSLAKTLKYDHFVTARWSVGDEFNMSIGQGDNAYTPLQVAGYTATLGNNGIRNKLSIIDSVEGDGSVQKKVLSKVSLGPKDKFNEVIEGMRLVSKDREGNLYKSFKNFPIDVASKTGTAEREGKINPKNEKKYIKKYLQNIAPSITQKKLDQKAREIKEANKGLNMSENTAYRKALTSLDKSLTDEKIDRFKSDYDNFAWGVALAPAKNPKVAVCVLLVQGGSSDYTGPVIRDMIAKALNIKKERDRIYDINSGVN